MILEHRFAHIPQEGRRGRAWLASVGPLFEGTLEPGAIVPEDALLRYRHLGAIVLAIERGPAQAVTRSPERVRAQALDHLVVRTQAGGGIGIDAETWTGKAADGDLVVCSLAEPLRITMPILTSVTVVVPRRFLGEDEGDVAGVRGRVLAGTQDPLARLLAAHLVHLDEALETATPAQVDHLVAATLALCRAVLRGITTAEATGETAGAGGPTALRLAVRRYIEAHPASVDVAVLTRQFRLSRRSLYRLFADTDGVQAHIRERRLAHALRDLAKPGTSRRPKLARVAHACGFADPQAFSRAFRKRYGVSPVAVAVAPSSPALATGSETGLLGWLRDL